MRPRLRSATVGDNEGYVHPTIGLGEADRPRAAAFVKLFALSGFSRGLLLTVIPLNAHTLLGDAQRVSVLYFAVGSISVGASLVIPWLVDLIHRRRVFTLGAFGVAVAAALLAVHTVAALILGMMLYSFATTCLEICLSLYVMDQVPRRQLAHFEPARVTFAALGLMMGPWFGVYLQQDAAPWAPFALAAATALVMLGYFWILRLTENPALRTARRTALNPIYYLPHFFAQPRLRLAWVLALGRSAWWTMFFIYVPIYVVTAGFGEIVSGVIVSIASASLFIVPLWGWVGRRSGLRCLLVGGYTIGGLATLSVAFVACVPWLGAAVLIGAAFVVSSIDGAGNVPFLRAVRPFERVEMATMFVTYRPVAQLVPPGVLSTVLNMFELPAVFVFGGGAMLVLGLFARFVPRGL